MADTLGGNGEAKQDLLAAPSQPEGQNASFDQDSGSPLQRRSSVFGRVFQPISQDSMSSCVLALTFSAVGAGILGLPWAVAVLGWVLGLGLLLVCGAASLAALCMLAEVKQASGFASYAAAVEAYFGQVLGQILALILAIGSFGSCCASMMFATSFAIDLLKTTAMNHLLSALGIHDATSHIASSSLTKPLCIVALLALLLALVWPRDVTRWRYASVVSVVVLLYVSFVMVIKAISPAESDNAAMCQRLDTDAYELAVWPGMAKMAQTAAVYIFSYCGHFNLFPVLNTLGNPTKARSYALSLWATALQASLYVLVGLSGYIVWKQALLRSSSKGNVLACWDVDDVLVTLGRSFMMITLLVSSGLNLHPVRENILRFAFRLRSSESASDFTFSITEVNSMPYAIATALILGTVGIIVACVPSVLDVLGFVGGLCGVALMFVFPTALYFRVCVFGELRPSSPQRKIVAISPVLMLFTLLGCLGFISVGVSVHNFLT